MQETNIDIELDYNILFGLYQKKINNLTNQNLLLEAKLLSCNSKIEELQNNLISLSEKKESKSNSKSKLPESEENI